MAYIRELQHIISSIGSHSEPQEQVHRPAGRSSLDSVDSYSSIKISSQPGSKGEETRPVVVFLNAAKSPRNSRSNHFQAYPDIQKHMESMSDVFAKLSNATVAKRGAIVNSEITNILSDEKRAEKLEATLQKWQKQLPASHQTKILPSIWKNYRTTIPNANTFSALLSKLSTGFKMEFTSPSFSWSRGLYYKKQQAFATERLLPVLMAMQENPDLAKRLFCIAEDGLGECHDRPALTFVDIELEALSDIKLSELDRLPANPSSTSFVHRACTELVSLEHQKLRKSMVVSALIKEFKNAKKGNDDPLQNVIIAYDSIAKSRNFFPAVPYVSSVSFVDKNEQDGIRNRVISSIQNATPQQTKKQLVDHLLKSDNWLKLLVMHNPELAKSLQRIDQLRTRYSENLLELPQKTFLNHYAQDIQALDSAYRQARSNLLNEPSSIAFTEKLVDRYLRAADFAHN